jgi:NADH-quinone oxidoreductase subunit L
MENVLNGVSLVVFLPMIGMLTNLFLGKRLSEAMVGAIAVAASGGAFIVSLLLLFGYIANDFEPVIVNPPLLDGWIRIPSANVDIPWQFRVDALSITMMLVVSGVGTLIHLYAIGYMHGDARFARFFVYLNLFLMFMMILVTGNNLLMMFVGWEGVGLCSFLLIGFWFDKPDGLGWKNSNAARKAFIANRVGDFGVIMAVFLTFWTFGTLDYYKVDEHILHSGAGYTVKTVSAGGQSLDKVSVPEVVTLSEMGIYSQAEILIKGDYDVNFGSVSLSFETMLTLITLFMVLGATGKSAQIPLFVWLPDAMAGPTPVSALIHAATMVTAGVYMMVRSNSFFYHAEFTSFLVAVIGCATAIMAGFVAIGQWDVKRVLAYSTVSQLGFMVAAVGIGAYAAAMFHLVTHAVFKALLFLGSGSIIHGMEHGHHHLHDHHGDAHHDHEGADESHHADDFDPQDMRTMGGLRHKMPVTYWTYLIGTLALAGIFPFAGFWSKDEILADAFIVGWEDGLIKGFFTLLILLAAAGFTAFYMWRQMCLVFYGQARHEAAEHASESGWLMTLPLSILAVGSVVFGVINLPGGTPILGALFGEHHFTHFLEHAVVHVHTGEFLWWLALGAVAVALGAIFAARQVYHDGVLAELVKDPLELNPQSAEGFRLANAKLYWDETYYRLLERPFNLAAKWLADKLDWAFWHDFFHERVVFGTFKTVAGGLSGGVDRVAIDKGIMAVTAGGMGFLSGRLRKVQTGFVRVYALAVLVGTLVVLAAILFPVWRDLLGV